jgi:hypothetical protein
VIWIVVERIAAVLAAAYDDGQADAIREYKALAECKP